jgi:hypothetical protein
MTSFSSPDSKKIFCDCVKVLPPYSYFTIAFAMITPAPPSFRTVAVMIAQQSPAKAVVWKRCSPMTTGIGGFASSFFHWGRFKARTEKDASVTKIVVTATATYIHLRDKLLGFPFSKLDN